MTEDFHNPNDTGHLQLVRTADAIVVDVNDPDKAGRVRCMIIGLQEKIPKELLAWIPTLHDNQPSTKGIGFSPHNYMVGTKVKLFGKGQQNWEVACSLPNSQTDIKTRDTSESTKGDNQPKKPPVRGEKNYTEHNRLKAFADSANAIASAIDLNNSNNAVDWEKTQKEQYYRGPINNAEIPDHYNKRKTSRSQNKETIGVEQFISEYRNAQKFIKSVIGDKGSLLTGALDMIDNLYQVKDPLSVPLPTTQIGAANIIAALQSIFNLLKQNRTEIENKETSNTDDANTANSIISYTNYIEPEIIDFTVTPPTSNLVANAILIPTTFTVGNTSMNTYITYRSIEIGKGVGGTETYLQIGSGRTSNGYAYIDLVGDTTYTDYGLRIIRGDLGNNAPSSIIHKGTNTFYIAVEDAGAIALLTNNTTRLAINSTGSAVFSANVLGPTQANTDNSTLLATTAYVQNQFGTPISYNPTVTPSTGSITTYSASGTYRIINKVVLVDILVTLTDNGTGGGYVTVTLPATVNNSGLGQIFAGMNSGGTTLSAICINGTNTARIFKYDGTYPAATGQDLYVSGRFNIA